MLLNSIPDIPIIDAKHDAHNPTRDELVTAHFLRARETILLTATYLASFCIWCAIGYFVLADAQRDLLQTNSGKVLYGATILVVIALMISPSFMKGPRSQVDDGQLEPLPEKTGVPRRAINGLGILAALSILGASWIESGQIQFAGAPFFIALAVMNATTTMVTLFVGLEEFDVALKYQAEAGE